MTKKPTVAFAGGQAQLVRPKPKQRVYADSEDEDFDLARKAICQENFSLTGLMNYVFQ
jgi:hypothetical protein